MNGPLAVAWRSVAARGLALLDSCAREPSAGSAGNEQAPASPFERLARRADDMAKRSAALKKIADAGAPLYQSLDEEQKGRFIRLAHMLRPHSFMQGNWRRGEGDWYGWGHGGQHFDQELDEE